MMRMAAMTMLSFCLSATIGCGDFKDSRGYWQQVPTSGAGGQAPLSGMSSAGLGQLLVGYACRPEGPCQSVSGNALAAGGASVDMTVSGWNGEPIKTVIHDYAQVTSSNPSVVTAVVGTDTSIVHLVSGLAGTATLSFSAENGSPVDSVIVVVADAATLQPPAGLAGISKPLQLLADQSFDFHVTSVDAGQRALIGSGSVRFQFGGTLGDGGEGHDFSFGDERRFSGKPGSGSIVASTTNASVELDAVVVDDADLTLQAQLGTTQGANASIAVTAANAGGPVLGFSCSWSWSPQAKLVSQQSWSLDTAGSSETAQFAVSSPHQWARCTVGSQTTTVDLPDPQ